MNAEDAIRICIDLVKNHGWQARMTPHTKSIRLFPPDSTVEYDLLSAAIFRLNGRNVDLGSVWHVAVNVIRVIGGTEATLVLHLADGDDDLGALASRREKIMQELGIVQ